MKIKLGPAGMPITCQKKGIDANIKLIAELGLTALEIQFVRGIYISEKEARHIGALAQDWNIELSIHAPFFINLSSLDSRKIANSKRLIIATASRAEIMGCKIIVFHPGFYCNLEKKIALNLVLNACKDISQILKNLGIYVKLGLETTGKHSQVGTLEEILEITKQVKNCIPVIDFAHIYARNYGSINYRKIFDMIAPLNLKTIHSHFTSVEFTNKGERRHLPIKYNQPPFKDLILELIRRNQNITIISESPLLEIDSKNMLTIIRDLGLQNF
jgi:deoxyribonuclease-4